MGIDMSEVSQKIAEFQQITAKQDAEWKALCEEQAKIELAMSVAIRSLIEQVNAPLYALMADIRAME